MFWTLQYNFIHAAKVFRARETQQHDNLVGLNVRVQMSTFNHQMKQTSWSQNENTDGVLAAVHVVVVVVVVVVFEWTRWYCLFTCFFQTVCYFGASGKYKILKDCGMNVLFPRQLLAYRSLFLNASSSLLLLQVHPTPTLWLLYHCTYTSFSQTQSLFLSFSQ